MKHLSVRVLDLIYFTHYVLLQIQDAKCSAREELFKMNIRPHLPIGNALLFWSQ